MEKWEWVDWLDKGEIRLTDTLLADIKKEKSYYGNTFFALRLVKDNETYEVVAFVGKENQLSLEERINRKLNLLVAIKKLVRERWEDNSGLTEQLIKLEEQVELIKQNLKENAATVGWKEKNRIQRENERVEERLNKYSQLKAGNYYHFHLKIREKKGETYYVLLDFLLCKQKNWV
ncbi:MAG: hypothetical protein MRECE_54c004 [Mycoplasmataceae bacterium CE_OT135]|nr:MAG: hypothetical protein MRECE_54c004 [Mycoplasmataceae bacterium CE_OT135]